jgi:hypothetical protein
VKPIPLRLEFALMLALASVVAILVISLLVFSSDDPKEGLTFVDKDLDASVYSAAVVVEPFDANAPIGPPGQPHPPEVRRKPKTAMDPR